MIAAVLALLTLGSGHYIAHCRHAPEGCETRVIEHVLWATEAAEKHHLDPRLLLAIAMNESGMRPEAVGALGERGSYQLHPRGAGARALRMSSYGYPQGYADAFVAAQVLAEGLRTCGDLPHAIGYYNTGKCLSGPYVARVLATQAQL